MRIKSNKPVIDGIKFDSTAEAKRYSELKLLERAGKIRNLECHQKYKLEGKNGPILIRSNGYPNGRHATYTPDFEYLDLETNELVTEDVKGTYYGKNNSATTIARLKMAIFESCYNRTVKIVTR